MVIPAFPPPDAEEVIAHGKPTDNELLAYYRSEIRFETETVNGRLQALLSSQAFLVIAYATAMTGSTTRWGDRMAILIPPLLSLLGFMLTLIALPGIRAGYGAIGKWNEKEQVLHRRCPGLSEFTLGRSDEDARAMMHRARRGGMFAHQAPLVFLIAWSVFALIPFCLYGGF
ncbi:hypothetical protein ACFFGF_07330 [Asaia lannensis]|uniref:DUF2868 domain-containing protein n=1 Tax=Asaia lannensis NBRC 102526 TaxID=1307926 RepID=A0ABT1CJU6_9PROT|nr:hypothetical protein [Asaia lannensis]MCO6160831.1 hypothetical protein [Asaia lannensis NBRC 102526]GBR01340.1 hypothetical protein AA102526_2479 [Asaia lannensis NBRC 102526]